MTLLEVRNLTMEYGAGPNPTRAVEDVSFTLQAGASLGIVGESGCGKSSLLFAIFRLLRANARLAGGSVLFEGRDIVGLDAEALRALRWSRIAMVFQSAMNALNPVIRIGSLLAEAYAIHHPEASRADVRKRVDEVLDMVRIDRRVAHSYAHELSGGMRQRAVIALAMICRPKLLLADEPTTALDVVLQKAIMDQLMELKRELGFALILVTHDLSLVTQTCDDMAVMYAGQIVEMGATAAVVGEPRHPYTLGLLKSFPDLADVDKPLSSIAGHPPDLSRPMQGCRFADRCPLVEDACRAGPIALARPADAADHAHLARCRRTEMLVGAAAQDLSFEARATQPAVAS